MSTTDRAEQDLCRRVARQEQDPLGVATPAPWRLSLDAKTGAFAVEDDNRIAVLCSRAPWDHRASESAANARLIAAAPDLLQALKAMTEEWVDYMTINNIPGDPWAKHNMRLAKAAIDNAEGR